MTPTVQYQLAHRPLTCASDASLACQFWSSELSPGHSSSLSLALRSYVWLLLPSTTRQVHFYLLLDSFPGGIWSHIVIIRLGPVSPVFSFWTKMTMNNIGDFSLSASQAHKKRGSFYRDVVIAYKLTHSAIFVSKGGKWSSTLYIHMWDSPVIIRSPQSVTSNTEWYV